eukprot:CAMPEP_0168360964 /NCGR_PEP_ID=MMETSP0228-20121227/2426_1 /TAXON_ID=133427 /ORGANISM="Protoceratium reticulatum, Strain CCCM 535 (=CCMP 1889)" /LENGTH=319 /DNA_ID=CAMNT_0008373635 /DNA_START=67 /DNA_END=1023 /DNA_ORIENTATION=+
MKLFTVQLFLLSPTGGVRMQPLFPWADLEHRTDGWGSTENGICVGDELKQSPVTDMNECKTLCVDDTSCKGVMTYMLATQMDCVLFSTISSVVSNPSMTCTKYTPETADSSGDPHSRNLLGQHFDIRRPGNYTFLKLPRGSDGKGQNLDVQAHVTSRGDPCSGQLYITGLEITGSWLSTVGGRIIMYTETDMFNSPEVVGLKVGNSMNISVQDLGARIPTDMLTISHYSPHRPKEMNKHVTILTMQFHFGPSTMKVGWSHEKIKDGYTNWLWLSVSRLGDPKTVGGLLGADEHLAVQSAPEDCKGKPGLIKTSPALKGW